MDVPRTVTQHDIEVFKVLQEYPCLSLPFIAELLGHKPTVKHHDNGKVEVRYKRALRGRLTELRQMGYLRWPINTRPRREQKNRPAVYALTPIAKTELRNRGLDKPTMRLTNNVNHDLGSCFIAASFKLGVMADNRLRLIPAQHFLDHPQCPDKTRTSAEPFSIPLAYWHRDTYVEAVKKHDWPPFGIGYRNGERERKIYFAGFEYDRDTEGARSDNPNRSSVERHIHKILALLDGGYKTHFGTARFFVLIVAPRERNEVIKRVLLDLTNNKGHERILFDTLLDWEAEERFPSADGHMLTQAKQRAGYPPFDILKELGAKQ